MEPPGQWGASSELRPPEIFGLAGFGQRLMGRIIDDVITTLIPGLVFLLLRDPSGFTWFGAGYLGGILLSFFNDVTLTTLKGGTIGKLIVGTRVVHLPERSIITAGTASRRWAAMTALILIPFAGLVDALWIFTGQMRQTLHDKFAETIVVQARAAR